MTKALSDSEVANIFKKLSSLVEDTYEEVEDIIGLEVELAKKGIEDQSSQGFWDSTTLASRDQLEVDLEANAVFNPSEVNTAGVKFNNVLTTLFGGQSVVPDVDTSLSTAFSEKLNSTFDSGFTSCDTGVSAVDTVQGIVNIQRRKLQNVFGGLKATFGVLMGSNAEVGPAVFVLAVKNYLIKITAQDFLLRQIKDEITNINEDIESLTDSDYSINHKTVISASVVKLNEADNILRAQLDNVLRSFPVNFKGYDAARQHIDDVRDVLCGIDLNDIFGGFLSLDVLKISARLIYLEELLTLLDATDREAQRILLNLGSFDTAFEDVTFFDSLLIPVLQLLRCRLAVVQADMQQTSDKNQLATFVIKEKEWCFELSILSALMKASKVFDIDTTTGPLSLEPIQPLLDSLFTDVSSAHFVVSIESIQRVAKVFVSNVRYKLSFNVPVLPVQVRGELVNRLIDQRVLENSSFQLLIGGQTLGVEGRILTGITIFNKFLGSVQGTEALSKASQELVEGNLKGLFNGDFLSDTLSGTYERFLTDISAVVEDAGHQILEVGDKSLAAYDIFEDVTRSEALFNDSLAGFPETNLRQHVTGELPKYDTR